MQMLDAADARADRVLAEEPHPCAAFRNPRSTGEAAVDRLLDEHYARQSTADAAAERAKEAVNGRSWWTAAMAAIGITTPTQRAVDRLHDEATALAMVARTRAPERSDLEAARSRGAADGHRAMRAQAAWEVRPDVVQAIEERRLNGEVRDGVRRGDPDLVRAVLGGNMLRARHIIREREEAVHQTDGGIVLPFRVLTHDDGHVPRGPGLPGTSRLG